MSQMTGKWQVWRVLRNRGGLQVEGIGGSNTGRVSPLVFRSATFKLKLGLGCAYKCSKQDS